PLADPFPLLLDRHAGTPEISAYPYNRNWSYTPPLGADPLPVIGCVAALRPEKNLARLLRAAALTARTIPIRLLIVGDGPECHRLTALAAELALNIEFAGNIPDTAAFYRRMTIFTLASDTEQMPLSILEAMASGLPIAATAVGDTGSMIAASNRPYLTARDDEALSQALNALLANPAHAKMIGRANRARAEELFSETRMIEEWFSVIMQALQPADHRSTAGIRA
ncbi:MAG TPA: glycosyltransferase family 4 protein, partial [Acetobacteraceae bacterium]|nr:glycosyltransferase family 4 protein [Acetobacteraceae bacterium]